MYKKLNLVTMALTLMFISSIAIADDDNKLSVRQFSKVGIISSINISSRTIVINDRIYKISSSATIKKIKPKKHLSLSNLSVNQKVGFKSINNPDTPAPYKSLITRMWVLPTN